MYRDELLRRTVTNSEIDYSNNKLEVNGNLLNYNLRMEKNTKFPLEILQGLLRERKKDKFVTLSGIPRAMTRKYLETVWKNW